ncbi:type II secretion system protein [Photobacterium makurazakiensis]|uniref:type II secretion system protein n=1 Tax=Photobacterium makurazakiensis TaxID=2910234 RepID=UPI003D127EC7
MKNKGFTLIEMVVVIVILGILAVTAAPRFMNLQSDARIATLDGFLGAFKAADEIIIGKAMIYGIEAAPYKTLVPSTDVYIEAGHINLHPDNIKNAMDANDFKLFTLNKADSNSDLKSVFIYQADRDLTFEELRTKNCFVHISTSASSQDGDDVVYIGGLHFRKFYDGC